MDISFCVAALGLKAVSFASLSSEEGIAVMRCSKEVHFHSRPAFLQLNRSVCSFFIVRKLSRRREKMLSKPVKPLAKRIVLVN